jgi:hypothetical protein
MGNANGSIQLRTVRHARATLTAVAEYRASMDFARVVKERAPPTTTTPKPSVPATTARATSVVRGNAATSRPRFLVIFAMKIGTALDSRTTPFTGVS